MNKKRYKAIEKWLSNGKTNKEHEAYLAIRRVSKWTYSSYPLHEIEAFVIIRANHKVKEAITNPNEV